MLDTITTEVSHVTTVATIGHNGGPAIKPAIDADFTATAHQHIDEAFAGTRKIKDLINSLGLTYRDEEQVEAIKAIIMRRWVYRCFYEQTNSAQRASALTEQCWTMTPKARKNVKERHDALTEQLKASGEGSPVVPPELKHWHNMNNARVFTTRLAEECGLKEPARKRASKDDATDTARNNEVVASLPTQSIELNNDNLIIPHVKTAHEYATFMLNLARIAHRFHAKNASCETGGLATDLANVIADINLSCKEYKLTD